MRSADGGLRRRRGIVASLRAEPYDRRIVLPHERTHAEPIRSRLRLLRAAQAQLEPLFFLYEGVPPLDVPERPPDLEADDTRLWRVADDGSVLTFFADRQILIADGHHRYETSLAYAAERDRPGPTACWRCSSRPTTRGSRSSPRTVSSPAGRRSRWTASAATGCRMHSRGSAAESDRSAAVVYRAGAPVLVEGDHGELDVELVDRFGLDGISYTVDANEAGAASTRRGGLRDARPADTDRGGVRARRPGDVMPQKATHFFPKLTSGLLFQPLDDA